MFPPSNPLPHQCQPHLCPPLCYAQATLFACHMSVSDGACSFLAMYQQVPILLTVASSIPYTLENKTTHCCWTFFPLNPLPHQCQPYLCPLLCYAQATLFACNVSLSACFHSHCFTSLAVSMLRPLSHVLSPLASCSVNEWQDFISSTSSNASSPAAAPQYFVTVIHMLGCTMHHANCSKCHYLMYVTTCDNV